MTLTEAHELTRSQATPGVRGSPGPWMAWPHLPIVEADGPDAASEVLWKEAGPRLLAWPGQGSRILLHCRGGLGRTGTIAARLPMEQRVEANLTPPAFRCRTARAAAPRLSPGRP